MNPLVELADRWRDEAEMLRSYAAEPLATACEKHADELEAALGVVRLEAVTLDEAHEIGGYSYSHLQHLVADGTIPNVGSGGKPRIRRQDVPVKPGHGAGNGSLSKTELLEDALARRRRQE